MDISLVRKRLLHTVAEARSRAQERRERSDEAGRAYAAFLQDVATPLIRQVAMSLKAEGYAFTLFTPGDSVRLAHDRSRDDFIELAFDASGDQPQVVGRVSQARGSRRFDEERPIKPGASPAAITEDEVLEFVMRALEPWLAR